MIALVAWIAITGLSIWYKYNPNETDKLVKSKNIVKGIILGQGMCILIIVIAFFVS